MEEQEEFLFQWEVKHACNFTVMISFQIYPLM